MTRPGWKTSEFWLTLIATTVGGLIASGVVANGTTLDRALALAAVVLSSLGYTVQRTRAKQQGSSALVCMLTIAMLGAGALIASCATAKQTARATSAAVVDCTAEAFAANAEQYAGRVRDAVVKCTGEAGTDWGCVGDAVAELGEDVGLEVAGCAAVRVAKEMLSPGVAPVDRGRIEAGWERVRIERLGGVAFETGAVR